MTILSLFGLFGLSGIVVNDSIILVSFYKRLRAQGMAVQRPWWRRPASVCGRCC